APGNGCEQELAYGALQLLGGVATPVNFRLGPGELRYVLADSGARVAVAERSTAAALAEAADGLGVRVIAVGEGGPAGDIAFDEVAATRPGPLGSVAADDLSLLLYT